MALEAIHLHRRIAVAALAEIVLAQHAEFAFLVRRSVALDAVLQTVLLGANAFVHGLVTMMVEHLHVILAHVLGRFHALIAIAVLNHRLGHAGAAGRCCQRRPRNERSQGDGF
jgi:hypothetical protein